MKQLIFVVETTKTIQSDDRYIRKLINFRYDIGNNETKIQFVHMEGKSKYNDKSVIFKINKLKNTNKGGENYIIYCFDTDQIDCNQDDITMFNNEKDYCKKNNYLLIWFNSDIEFVLLGKSVESNEKKQESIRFFNKKEINVSTLKLQKDNENFKGHSNIFLILDNLLLIKKEAQYA